VTIVRDGWLRSTVVERRPMAG